MPFLKNGILETRFSFSPHSQHDRYLPSNFLPGAIAHVIHVSRFGALSQTFYSAMLWFLEPFFGRSRLQETQHLVQENLAETPGSPYAFPI
jgi:hypothetical protein